MVSSLLNGALLTVEIAGAAAVVTTVVAPIAAIARMSRFRIVRFLIGAYVEFFRGSSALVQLLFAFYVLPLFGIYLPAFFTAVLVLGLNLGSYGAEIVRGAVQAVPRGQHEAAFALGMSPFAALRRIIVPQAVLAMVPPWTNLMIDLIKTTSFASLISLTELTFQSQILITTSGGQNLPAVLAVTVALYIAMAQVVAYLGRWVERRLSRGRDVGRQATRLAS